jgi:hypothetical protein
VQDGQWAIPLESQYASSELRTAGSLEAGLAVVGKTLFPPTGD